MSQKKRRLKIDVRNKKYPIVDSCLFRLQSKRKLSEFLNTELFALKNLTDDRNYNCYIDTSGHKPREIEHPCFELDKIQTRIASLICRIAQPDYIHSGVKGRSHITNAKQHVGRHNVLTSDIQSFFPSTTQRMVFNFFYKRLQCSSDVADLLANLCTCKGHIPTGSRISMPLAFWANEPMFNLLHKVSLSQGITFTVFVDDIVFSGSSIDERFVYNIKKLISNHGHTAHPRKTKLYKAGNTKLVTGVAVDTNGLHVANRHRKNIYQDMSQWKVSKQAGLQFDDLNKRIIGRMNAQSLVDYRFKDKARTLRLSIKKKN
ncbi:reverse transcriptase family protein [Nitrosomonas sp.]|uniref:reverse transcriptase family protein n=1 Tax=Nitrosomonas sp. TaxID=42353 RepID=UPI001E0DFCA0|nr:reverse transcriptase family protein [Nitrosomonas sp.]MCB1949833.1 RNA-directed DNA polymerase [Nitrosomonas sp.]